MPKLRILLAGVAGAAAGVAAWLIPASRRVPAAERERRRRLAVHARGRIGGAMIGELHNAIVSYRYSIAGIEYAASQDVSTLIELLPADPDTLTERPTAIKYLPENPANSIVLCEAWSGLDFPRTGTNQT